MIKVFKLNRVTVVWPRRTAGLSLTRSWYKPNFTGYAENRSTVHDLTLP